METLFFPLYRLVTFAHKIFLSVVPTSKPNVLAGKSALQNLMGNLCEAGHQRVLIVSDQGISELGMLKPLTDKFFEAEIETRLFLDVLPDPSTEIISTGIQQAKTFQADAVLAVGGGSVIDAAKLIAALANRKGSIARKKGLMRIRRRGLPLYAVPTTAGTGSEATMAAVVTLPGSSRKVSFIDPVLVPCFATLDPKLTLGLPPALTAAAGMDALTHALEALLSKNASEETDAQAFGAAKDILEYLPRAYEQGNDFQARQRLLEASFQAGLAFNRAGVGYVHAIAHQIGGLYKVPHGLANAIILPHVLRMYALKAPKALQRVIEQLTSTSIHAPEQDMTDFINQVEQLAIQMGIPGCIAELKLDDIPKIAKRARAEARFLYAVPVHLSQKQCVKLVGELLPVEQ